MFTFDKVHFHSQEMQNAIDTYQVHLQNNTKPNTNELETSQFLAYIDIVYEIQKAEKSLKTVEDWMELKVLLEKKFDLALRHSNESRCLRSSVNLLKAWLYANIVSYNAVKFADLKEKSEKLFEVAKKEEAKENLDFPISGGKVHHLSAALAWSTLENADDARLIATLNTIIHDLNCAVEKGFDYTIFAFTKQMVELTIALMKQDKKLPKQLMPKSLSDLSLEDIVTDKCIYIRAQQDYEDYAIENQSLNFTKYYFAIMLLSLGKKYLAASQLKLLVNKGELPILCHISENDTNDVKEIKLFWNELLSQNYRAFSCRMYDALARYFRNDTGKQSRNELRNQMLDALIQIDRTGTKKEDNAKIHEARHTILPILVRLAGTDLSANQIKGIGIATSSVIPSSIGGIAISESLSQLVMNLFTIFVETVGLSIQDLQSIDPLKYRNIVSTGTFDEKLAMQASIKYVKDKNAEVANKTSKYALFPVFKSEIDKLVGSGTATPSHSLLFLAEMELLLSQKNPDDADLKKQLDKIYQQFCKSNSPQFDPLTILWVISRRRRNSTSQSRFEILLQNGELNENTSFLDFRYNQTLTSNCGPTERNAIISYIMALVLYSKKQYKIGSYYMAQAFILGQTGQIFFQTDRGFVHDMFIDRNWPTFFHVFSQSMQCYIDTRDKTSQVKVIRVDYVKHILRTLNEINDNDNNAITHADKINQFKERVLPSLLFLAGLNLGKSQRVAIKSTTLQISNLCKATKNGINIATQLLGITPEDFIHAKSRCMSKPTDDLPAVQLGMEATEAYFNQLRKGMEIFANVKKCGLERACYPYLSQAIGEFNWQPLQISPTVVKHFLGKDLDKYKKGSEINLVNDDDTNIADGSESSDEESEIYQPLPLTLETMNSIRFNTQFTRMDISEQIQLPPPPIGIPNTIQLPAPPLGTPDPIQLPPPPLVIPKM